jgi:hypothetical protein
MRSFYVPLSMRSSSTRVWECQAIARDKGGKTDGWQTVILKDCWMNEAYPTDLEIQELLHPRPKSFWEVSQPTDEVFGLKDAFKIFSRFNYVR